MFLSHLLSYVDYFQTLVGFEPYPWQRRFATWDGDRVAVVPVPTGGGKESGAVVPWLYGRMVGQSVPSRIIYVLPTRSLVEQVMTNVRRLVERSQLDISVYCLKGGQLEEGFEDVLAQPGILVGTQDQLLTRALNRGYAVGWAQRPKHAAAVNNDCRWILDETQLMGVGYGSAVQLHALRRKLGAFGPVQLACLSATLDRQVLDEAKVPTETFDLSDDDLRHPYLGAKLRKPKPVSRAVVADAAAVAELVAGLHCPGDLSLVVCNTVDRARAIAATVQAIATAPTLTVHSQFLGRDRDGLQQQLHGFRGIVVATQVVEAGVDLDAGLLVTELCPWSSFVQRVGRAGRNDMEKPCQVVWVQYERGWSASPYDAQDIEDAIARLEPLTDAGLLSLGRVSPPVQRVKRYVIDGDRLREFFYTHPALRSERYSAPQLARDAQTLTVRVVWAPGPPTGGLPHQRDLCPVPTRRLKRFLEDHGVAFWIWNGDDGWRDRSVDASQIQHGDLVCLPREAGGYSNQLGWTGDVTDRPKPYAMEVRRSYDTDRPFAHRLTLKVHSADAGDELRAIAPHLSTMGLDDDDLEMLVRCARHHDWGKVHEVWQRYARADPGGEPVAKSTTYGSPQELDGYRHELASAIAAAACGADFLEQYLIAAHHGKVRETLLPLSGNFDPMVLRGVRLGSCLPPVELGHEAMAGVVLHYPAPQRWQQGVDMLLETLGPFRLWYLETLIRNADVAASKKRELEAKNA